MVKQSKDKRAARKHVGWFCPQPQYFYFSHLISRFFTWSFSSAHSVEDMRVDENKNGLLN
jgi:hypothetical protein